MVIFNRVIKCLLKYLVFSILSIGICLTVQAQENSVLKLYLVNTASGEDINLELNDNSIINLRLYNHGLTLRAEVSDDVDLTISKVNGIEVNRLARTSLSLNGLTVEGKYAPFNFQANNVYSIEFTPARKISGIWQRGEPYKISLAVEDRPLIPIIKADVVISGDFGESEYRTTRKGALTFDATKASFTVDNCGWDGERIVGGHKNEYPVILESNLAGSKFYGGKFNSVISQKADWYTIYNCPNGGNSVALMAKSNVEVIGIRINGPWDGVRFSSTGLLRDSYISNSRDDAIEADAGKSVTIENTLLDNVFVGISSTPDSNSTKNKIILRNTLIKLGDYLRKGEIETGAFVKATSNTPSIEIHNSVFAFSSAKSITVNRSKVTWSKVINCSNNLLLWLPDTPFPSIFPKPPACFRIITGAEARSLWQNKRNTFIKNYNY